MAEARTILGEGVSVATLGRLGEALAVASRWSEFIPQATLRAMHNSESSASVLESDPGGATLVLAEFSAKAETPVHDHGAWGIACVVRGVDRYKHYDPPAHGPGGVPRLRFERVLDPGDFVTWLDPPDDIHSQQAIGEPALEIILFGKNVMAMPRRYYDMTSGRVRTALPQ